ncbi:DUF927 domain-containing protein [Desulfofundulus thermobenzoicus]|uniref:DUF927 domain-containing protein n=1 Tax=Desulfofundulus thermobenzoicus TaxID=29376 RepID=A0A6N7IP38_9FIRM|nr:DUF927 domain-containing protein [Desulfofundulus thermobenzoicus]MQL51795.1 DUF927 domain-containing protein [Desulfofundulus thermobenzoicus]
MSPENDKKILAEAHKTKLLNAGIPEKMIETAGIFSVTADEIYQLTGVKVFSTGIAFPYPGENNFIRIRLDAPKGDLKYVSAIGAGCRLYVPPGADLNAETVVITEGEKKALVAVTRGINCVAVAGIDAWREKGPLGEKQAPGDAILGRLKKDWSGQTVILVYDSDITQSHKRWNAFPTLAEILYDLGAETVKIFSLLALPDLNKTGLDDFILAYEKAGEDAVSRFWTLAGKTPEWLPMGTGAEKYASARLKSADPEAQVRGAAALLAAKGEYILQQTLAAIMKAGAAKMLAKSAKKALEEAEARQKCTWKPDPGAGAQESVAITDVFPPAAQVISPEFPMPPVNLEGWGWDIEGGKIVRVKTSDDGSRIVRPGVDTVALLTAWLSPVEEGGEEKWELSWLQNKKWVRRHFSSGVLFDTREKQTLIKAGVEINSNNAEIAVEWFHSLRVLVTQNGVTLPTVRTVSRCGWHELDGKPIFVLGREVITPDAGALPPTADGGENPPELEKPDDIDWAGDVSPLERQILASFGVRGDPAKHKEFLLSACLKHPAIAFGIGCAAGAPLIKLAQGAGLAPDFAGFTVMMCSRDAGRKRHQGKTTWSQVVASFYGNPAVGENGRIRYADRTGVSTGVLLSTCCDLTVHLDELQLMNRGTGKRGGKNEVEHFVRTVTQGMDRERGARGGGGRRTRTFRTVVFATAESDVTVSFETGGGAHDRIMKLPQLLSEESDENRAEAEYMSAFCMKNYGWAGKEYLQWLLELTAAGKESEIAAEIERAVSTIREYFLPDDDRRGSAGRLATRAAIGLAGLSLWLEQIGATKDAAKKAFASFLAAWKQVCDGIEHERIDEKILAVIQSYVAANQDRIYGLRGDAEPRNPVKWVGAKAKIQGKECVVLFENDLAEEIERRISGMAYEQAREILKSDGWILVKKDGNKTRYTQKVHKGSLSGQGLAFPIELLFPPDAEEGKEVGDENMDVPF